MGAVTIVPLAPLGRRYRGKRARRAAFYGRRRLARRLARVLTRLVNHIDAESRIGEVVQDAYLDALVRGSAWYRLTPDGRGFVRGESIPDVDWRGQ